MKAVFHKTMTEVNIKATLEQLTTEYQEGRKRLADGIRAANQRFKENVMSDVYTPEYLRTSYEQEKDRLLSAALNDAKTLNAKAVQCVKALKSKAVPALNSYEKSSNFPAKVNNALQFIQIEGKDIDDNTAFQILREFVDDMETMQRFLSVIEHQKGEKLSDAYGNTTFPLTFGRLFNSEKFIKALSELEEMAGSLFVRKLAQTETEFFHGVTLSVPMDSYMQLVTERNIIEQAELVEEMISELFTTTD